MATPRETATQKANRLQSELDAVKTAVIALYQRAKREEEWCDEADQIFTEGLAKVGIELPSVKKLVMIAYDIEIEGISHDDFSLGKLDQALLDHAMELTYSQLVYNRQAGRNQNKQVKVKLTLNEEAGGANWKDDI